MTQSKLDVWADQGNSELADILPTFPPERSTSIGQVNLEMLEARDKARRENQMPEPKVVNARAHEGIG